jgi:hypothetical protein
MRRIRYNESVVDNEDIQLSLSLPLVRICSRSTPSTTDVLAAILCCTIARIVAFGDSRPVQALAHRTHCSGKRASS